MYDVFWHTAFKTPFHQTFGFISYLLLVIIHYKIVYAKYTTDRQTRYEQQ